MHMYTYTYTYTWNMTNSYMRHDSCIYVQSGFEDCVKQQVKILKNSARCSI